MKVTIQDSRTSVTVEPRDFRVTVSGARGPAGPAGANEWGEITGDIIDQTDLYNALEDKVPYTGATGDVNLGEHKLMFANASELREGTYDFGGQGGISQICSVGFENNWQSGFNHIFDNNGLIRESLHCFDIVPDSSFDSSLRFKIGSLWKLDDGTIYECVDATIGAAVWQLYNPYETDISGLVPYTGATADVNLGEYGAQLGNLEFDNTPTNVPTTAGSVYWNDTDGTLNMVLKGGQTISRIGETQHIRALNNTGAQIARGKVVYVVGAQGQRLTIALADADTEILSKDTIGFTAEAIADGAEGFVIVQGVINNISTTGMTDGATVYLSQTAGSYTTTPPADPAHLVILGFIVNGGSGGAGSIYVKVDNGYELEELHNVSNSAKTTPVADDALFLRDSADNNLWKRLTWTNALAGVKTHMDTFKSVSGGYASLDGSGKVPSNELPSYVDDVVEVANYAALPVTGETGKIYVTIDTNKCYRWSGTVYVQVAQGVDTLTTTGTSGAATLVGSTLNIPQYQSVLTNPVTGTGASGQVAYWSGTDTQTGSANLFWDNANGRFGVGTSTPAERLSIQTTTSGATTNIIHAYSNSGAQSAFRVTELGNGIFRNYSSIGSLVNNGYGAVGSNYYMDGGSTRRTGGDFVSAIDFPAGGFRFVNAGNGSANSLISFTTVATISQGGDMGLGISTTTPSARLHVRGSGPTSSTTALLVQNSTPTELFKVLDNGNANFGTGMYWDNANGRLGIGPNAPAAPLHTTSVNGEYVNAIFQYSDTSIYGGNLIVRKSRGSNSSPTAVLQNDRLGALGFAGYDGSIWNNSAVIFANADENWSASNRGSRFTFELTPNGSTSRVERMRITNTGNVLIGNTDGTGRLTVRGSGTTSSTTALLVQNGTPSELFKVLDNGAWNFNGDGIVKGSGNTGGTTALTVQNSGGTNLFRVSNDNGILIGTRPAATIYPTAFGSVYNINGRGIAMSFVASDTAYEALTLTHGNFTATADGYIIVNTIGTFNPTSGTATYTGNRIGSTINQTGGANGITRGLYVNPTLTAAADWRSIETSNNTGYAAYFAGSADLFLGNGTDIQIGTTTGTKIGTATSQKIGFWNATPIVQPTTGVAAATRVGGGGTTVTDTDTFDGYTIAQLVKALRNMGALE